MKYSIYLLIGILLLFFGSCETEEEPIEVVSLVGVYEGNYTTTTTDSATTTIAVPNVRLKIFTVAPNLYTIGVFRDSFLMDTIRQYQVDFHDNEEELETCDYMAKALPQVYRPFYLELNRTNCTDLYLKEAERTSSQYEERTFEGVRITKF